jgi:hypothetical protein
MTQSLQKIILNAINAKHVEVLETVQTLWSGYGQIIRLSLDNNITIIVKHIKPPNQSNHPRGWNTSNSHQRKLKSYEVEQYWYSHYGKRNIGKIPRLIHAACSEGEQLLVLEDLDASGYEARRNSLTFNEVKLCLSWLSNFHAEFINDTPTGLWKTGTYWHLATRPDELQAMKPSDLRKVASNLDEKLSNCKYLTFVHGDAKVANFCFSSDMNKVAALDFQYVGGGCGMKDVVYLMGSCLDEDECELYAEELLNYYFSELENQLSIKGKNISFEKLETEWRSMYPIAWADFTRFLMGWMPTHQKLNSYSKKQVKKALSMV